MLYSLENDFLQINVSNHGAELHNIIGKKDTTEFLWSGDSSFWKYHAPILFPIVGKVKNGQYKVDGKIFELPQHGLARISEFNTISTDKNKISFELLYSNDTLKVYPYKFSLIISYELIENSVKISYSVKNLDDKTIYFSIGAHPGFMCPLNQDETIDDYYFEFDSNESANLITLDTSTGLISHNTVPYLNDESRIYLNKDLFKDDALIFKNLKSNLISLKSKNHNKTLSMNFSDFPYLGLWSMPTGAPFVCIEPWFGHADFVDFDGEFKEKAGVESLNVNDVFNCSYSIIINE